MITATPGAPLPHARHHGGGSWSRPGKAVTRGQPLLVLEADEDGARPESGQGRGGRRPCPAARDQVSQGTLLVHFATDHRRDRRAGRAP